MLVATTRQQKKAILARVFKDILDLEDDSNLHKACAFEDIVSMDALLTLTPLEIEDLTFLIGTTKTIISKGHQRLVSALQALAHKRDMVGDRIYNDWKNVDQEEFDRYKASSEFQAMFPYLDHVPTIVPSNITLNTPAEQAIVKEEWLVPTVKQYNNSGGSTNLYSICQQSPKPVTLCDDTIINGEHHKDWGAIEICEPFDVAEFQAAMVHASETLGCLEEEEFDEKFVDIKTRNDSTKILDDTIMFFGSFCLEDDFCLYYLDGFNVPSDEFKHVCPANVKPKPTSMEAETPYHTPTMEVTRVHIEYPDRTKFVSSMNYTQYEELKSCNDNDCGVKTTKLYCEMNPFKMLGSDRIFIRIGFS
jgi:hypothetical protein